jgi:hypothetical protein
MLGTTVTKRISFRQLGHSGTASEHFVMTRSDRSSQMKTIAKSPAGE